MASKIGAQLYTLREFTKTTADLAKTMQKVRDIGYEAAQLSGAGPIDPKDVKKIIDDTGVKIVATHVSWDRFQTELDAVADEHLLWGCPNAAIGGIRDHSEQGYRTFAKEGSEVGRKLAEKGLTFSYHNHDAEFQKFGDRVGMDIIYGESDPRYLFAEIDTYWVTSGGGDPIQWIRKLKGRQVLLHLKDMGCRPGHEHVMMEIGEGNLNMPGIIEAGEEVGVEWYLVEQDTCQRDPFESMKISYDNLREMGLE